VTLSPSAAAAKSYYTEGLSKGDYYVQGQELPGQWRGKGAEQLGLNQTVEKKDFERLCDNLHPTTGRKLTARTKTNRRVGYDINFHAPKSLSLLYAKTGDPRILEGFQKAIGETMAEMEEQVQTRVRRKGARANRTTGNLVWGEFIHLTARPVDGVPDPHLHAHCFTFNATFDSEEDKWKAAEFGRLKSEARYFEAGFHARLAKRMADAGFAIRRTGSNSPAGWELEGVSDDLVRKFSRRSTMIEQQAEDLGITAPEAKAALGAKTRAAKQDNLTMSELRLLWDARLSSNERKQLEAAASGQVKRQTPTRTADESIAHAIGHEFARHSVRTDKEMLETALRHGVGDIDANSARSLLNNPELLSFVEADPEGDRTFVTSQTVLREEERMLGFAREGRGSRFGLVPQSERLSEEAARFLNEDQARAIHHVWRSRDRVMSIRGGAGVGKTTLMKEAVRGIEQHGKEVFTFAPSVEAARSVLPKEGFVRSETVAKLLLDSELQDRIAGQVIWIDEASLLGSRAMARVLDLAKEKDARVVLSGDIRQHRSVERGDALRLLETHSGVVPAEVNEIVRQRGDYKQAVASLAKGDVAGGWERLNKLGAIHEVSGEHRHEQLAADYLNAIAEKKTALVVSPTHAEGEAVTTEIRAGMRRTGRLFGEEQELSTLKRLGWTAAQRSDATNYTEGITVEFHRRTGKFKGGDTARVVAIAGDSITVASESGTSAPLLLGKPDNFEVYEPRKLSVSAGDRIRFTKNGKSRDGKHALNNGSIYDVSKVTEAGHLELANGWIVDKSHAHMMHGYCTTSHASQGKTVDRVFIAQGSESFRAASQEQFYVSLSRARDQVQIYTDDKEALKQAIQRTNDRRSATELAAANPMALEATARQSRLLEHAQWLQRWALQARAYLANAMQPFTSRRPT